MKVDLINYTGMGSPDPARLASSILLFTKATRLTMSHEGLQTFYDLPDEEREAQLTYMANTLPSSWEFVDYTFLIQDVTRAFTHQLVRTRTGSYAQQAQRIAPMEAFTYETGPTIQGKEKELYDATMAGVADAYSLLVNLGGVAREDARGLLPTNIHTNIVAKFNLRTLADTVRKRSSGRVQSEYQMCVRLMRESVLAVHPWASLFLDRTADKVALELQEMINELAFDASVDEGNPKSEELRLNAIKRLDQLRGMLG